MAPHKSDKVEVDEVEADEFIDSNGKPDWCECINPFTIG